MAESKHWILEIYKSVKGRFNSWEGLVGSIIVALAIFHSAIWAIGPHAKNIVLYFFENVPRTYFSFAIIAADLLIVLSIWICWIAQRRIPKFPEDKVGILFSSSNPDELKQQVEDLQSRIQSELKEKDLLNIIEIGSVPPNIHIDAQTALEKVLAAKAALLVWGFFESTEAEGRKVTGFPKINFTYTYPSNVTFQFHQDVAMSLMGRKWVFGQQNEFIEKSLVITNITQVALNTVAMSLLVKGYFQQAEALFAVLDVDLEQVRRSRPTPLLIAFCQNVRRNHVAAILLRLQNEYKQIFRREGIFHISQTQLNNWKVPLNEAIKLDKRDSRLFIFQATISFLSGEIEDALKATRRAHGCAPTADPNPDFCFAFLHLYRGDFRKARNSYKIALAKKGSDNATLIVEIVEFIQQVLETNPDKCQLHFALALLNEERLDSTTAKEEYRLFIEEAKDGRDYSILTKEAQRRLDRLNQPT